MNFTNEHCTFFRLMQIFHFKSFYICSSPSTNLQQIRCYKLICYEYCINNTDLWLFASDRNASSDLQKQVTKRVQVANLYT